MSTTQSQLKTVADAPTDDQPETNVSLMEIVAQTVPVGDDLPDFDEFSVICDATKVSIEHAMEADR